MKCLSIGILLFLTCSWAPRLHGAVSFEWAFVGNPGNPADTEVAVDNTTGYGSVGYAYRLSKYEVTNAQYIEFLNAVAATDPAGLYNPLMASTTLGGITRSGNEGFFTYAIKSTVVGEGLNGADYSYADKPVVYVSYLDSMRFVNWLENGQPIGPEGLTTTESGVYSIVDGVSETRAQASKYFLPSENEWYKAAYHKNDGVTGHYWDYPMSTNAQSYHNDPLTDTGNSANFFELGEAMNGGSGFATENSEYPLTDVGAYEPSHSPYFTFDQAGNVWEWTESLDSPSQRVKRGGAWDHVWVSLAANFRSPSPPGEESGVIGFRIASIPEPVSALQAAVAIISVAACRRMLRSKA